jgi:hypothetical protein
MIKFLRKFWLPFLIGASIAMVGPVTGKVFAEVAPIKSIIPKHTHQISKLEVFWMYTMKKRFWDDGTKITVIYQDFNSKEHQEFCEKVLGVSVSRFERNVSTYINKGNAAYFIKAENQADVVRKVAKTIGAIGYLDSNQMIINTGEVEIFKIYDDGAP